MSIYWIEYEVRKNNAGGLFSWKSKEVRAANSNEAKRKAFDEFHEEGYETRGGPKCDYIPERS